MLSGKDIWPGLDMPAECVMKVQKRMIRVDFVKKKEKEKDHTNVG